MEVLTGIFGVLSMVWLVFGLGLLLLGQKVGTWKWLTRSEKAWKKKIAYIGFNWVMPAGILTTVTLIPLILLLGVVSFVVMLF